jgi:hypothetical protein
MRKFKQRLKNANAVIAQLRAGEWEFRFNDLAGKCFTARRKGRLLWVGDGGFFCDVNEKNAFGLLLRHYVWWMAARRERNKWDNIFSGRGDCGVEDITT